MGSFTRSFLVLALMAFSACGSGGGSAAGGSATTDPGQGGSPVLPVWRVELEGDNTTFSLSMIADGGIPNGGEEEVQGPAVLIPAGQIVSYEISGAAFTSGGVNRTGGTNVANGGPWLEIRLYKDGVQIESAQLSTNGTFHSFQPH